MRKGFYRLFILGSAVVMLALLMAETSAGQDRQPRRVVQFTGLLLTSDSLKPLPHASVWVQHTARGTTTDHYGFFSIPVFQDDTLRFSSVGYLDAYYTIPDTLTKSRYSAVQMMTRDTIHLAETVVYPWPTRQQSGMPSFMRMCLQMTMTGPCATWRMPRCANDSKTCPWTAP